MKIDDIEIFSDELNTVMDFVKCHMKDEDNYTITERDVCEQILQEYFDDLVHQNNADTLFKNVEILVEQILMKKNYFNSPKNKKEVA